MTKVFGEFEFDETRRRLTCSGRPVRLTGQALELLSMLLDRPGELLSREEIKGFLWPDSRQDLEHSLDVLVNRLRRILGDSGKTPQYIETVPRRGFRFLALVSDFDTTDASTQRDLAGIRGQKLPPVPGAFRKVALFAAIALIAALGGIVFARTRYQRFVPQRPAGSVRPPEDRGTTTAKRRYGQFCSGILPASAHEGENFSVQLSGVSMLEQIITPNIAGGQDPDCWILSCK